MDSTGVYSWVESVARVWLLTFYSLLRQGVFSSLIKEIHTAYIRDTPTYLCLVVDLDLERFLHRYFIGASSSQHCFGVWVEKTARLWQSCSYIGRRFFQGYIHSLIHYQVHSPLSSHTGGSIRLKRWKIWTKIVFFNQLLIVNKFVELLLHHAIYWCYSYCLIHLFPLIIISIFYLVVKLRTYFTMSNSGAPIVHNTKNWVWQYVMHR